MTGFPSPFLPPERVPAVRPAPEYVRALVRDLWEQTAAQRTLDSELRALYFQTNKVVQPTLYRDAGDPITRSGVAAMVVDHVRGLWTKPVRFIVPVPDVTVTALGGDPRERSTKLEEALNQGFAWLVEQQSTDPFALAKLDQFLYGRGWTKLTPVDRAYAAPGFRDLLGRSEAEATAAERERYRQGVEAHKQGRGLPVLYQHVPARSVLAVLGEGGPSEVIQIENRRLSTVLESYRAPSLGTLATIEQARLAQRVRFVSYANQRYYAHFVAERADWPEQEQDVAAEEPWGLHPLTPRLGRGGAIIEHGIGMVPYVPYWGLPTADRDPEKRSLSVLYHLRDLIPTLDALLTQKNSRVRMWAWPSPVLKLRQPGGVQVGQGERPAEDLIQVVPGMPIYLWESEDISFLVAPEGTGEADEHIAIIFRLLDRLGISPVSFGTAASDVSSGWLFNSIQRAATTVFRPLQMHHILGKQREAHLLLRMVARVSGEADDLVYIPQVIATGRGEPDRSRYLSIRRSDLEGPYLVRAEIEMDLPANEIAMGQHWRLMEERGYVSRDFVRERLGIDDPERMEEHVLLQQWRDSAEVKQWLIGELLAKAATKRDERALRGVAGGRTELLAPAALVEAARQTGAPIPGGVVAVPGMPPSPQQQVAAAAGGGAVAGGVQAGGQQAMAAVARRLAAQVSPPGRAAGVIRQPGGPRGR